MTANRRALLGLTAAAGVTCLLVWPDWSLIPHAGLDDSWMLGLSWAALLGMDWGAEIAFTYGPLSWLLQPSALDAGQVSLAALVFTAGVAIALGFAYLMARRSLALETSKALIVATGLTTTVMLLPTLVSGRWIIIPVLFGSLYVLRYRSLSTIVLIAILLGLLGHLKLSEAALASLFAAICVLGGRGVRGLLALIATAGITWLGLWLVAGHDITDMGLWIWRAFEISTGYGSAMRLEIPGLAWHYVAAAILIGLVVDQVWWAGMGMDRRRRLALALAVAVAVWLAWKAGFTRHDGHALIFVTIVLIVAAGLLLIGGRGHAARVGVLVVGAAVITTGLADWNLHGQPLYALRRSVDLSNMSSTMEVVIDDGHRRSLLVDAREEVLAEYELDQTLIEIMGDMRTAADPWDISAVWAADTPEWEPVPVMQVYSAYSPQLDAVNAVDLADRPRQLLRSRPYPAIDGRNPDWDTPRYQALIYCDYDVVLETERWQVLRPSGASRCGAIGDADSYTAQSNEPVPVPARPGAMTLVTIEPITSLLDDLVEILFARVPPSITYGGVPYRYAHGREATRLMLNSPIRHPAFERLPKEPYETISIDVPATITFEFRSLDPSLTTLR